MPVKGKYSDILKMSYAKEKKLEEAPIPNKDLLRQQLKEQLEATKKDPTKEKKKMLRELRDLYIKKGYHKKK